MLKKILVLGDSFAKYDKKNSHWVDLWWGKKEDIEHFGIGGHSHTYIVSEFLRKKNIQDYDLIIYCMTDFLRALLNEHTSTESAVENILTLYDNQSKIPFDETLHNIVEDGYHWRAAQSSMLDDDSHERYKSFYRSVNANWLARANLFAVESLILNCKLYDKNLILVSAPNNSILEENFKHEVHIFNAEPGDFDDNKGSVNHFSYDMNLAIANKFAEWTHKNRVKL